jgi:hypothetical protein
MSCSCFKAINENSLCRVVTMQLLRLKIQFGDAQTDRNRQQTAPNIKWIHTVNSPATTKIDELRRQLEKYLQNKCSLQHVRLVDLHADDGYILSKTDICADVLRDNDRITCIDMIRFVRENFPILITDPLWLQLKQFDTTDVTEKSIAVGLTTSNKLFVQIQSMATAYDLHLFSAHDLLTIAREKRLGKYM